jgi:hypothetical protein
MSASPSHLHQHIREEPGSNGTLTCCPTGVKSTDEHVTSSYACSLDEDCASTTHAVFVLSLPPIPPHGGEPRFDGTLTCHSAGVKTIAKQGTSFYACLLDENCISTSPPAVFVFTLSTDSK